MFNCVFHSNIGVFVYSLFSWFKMGREWWWWETTHGHSCFLIILTNLIHTLLLMLRISIRYAIFLTDQFIENFFDMPYLYFNGCDIWCHFSFLQVDNGCIEHLLPSLYKQDWDVLIAHFLGVVWLRCFFFLIEKLEYA